MLSLSVFAYYSGQMLRGSEADKVRAWRIANTDSLVFALISFVAATRNGVCRSKITDPCIVADHLWVLVPMPGRLARWIDDLFFYQSFLR